MRTHLAFGMLALLSALGFSAPAAAFSVASFTGTLYFNGACDDCTPLGGGLYGPGPAAATLFLSDYTWGDDLPMMVPFTYTSARMGTLAPAYAYNVTGSFSSEASAPADLYLEFSLFDPAPGAGFYTFQSNSGGSWDLTAASSTADYGSSHSWSVTPVPEPESYAMLIAGLGLLGFISGRRKRNLAA